MKIVKTDKIFFEPAHILVDPKIHKEIKMLALCSDTSVMDVCDQIFTWFFDEYDNQHNPKCLTCDKRMIRNKKAQAWENSFGAWFCVDCDVEQKEV